MASETRDTHAGAAEKSEDVWTVGRLLNWTTDYLRTRGSESPRLDAEVMLASVLEWERVQLYTHFEDVVGELARQGYRQLVRRRAEGAPVAYLVGRKEFFSLRFDVSPAVLIPRPESEFVVVEVLEAVKGCEAVRAVDVGTGSGCLAVACAAILPMRNSSPSTCLPDALAQARKNAARHELTRTHRIPRRGPARPGRRQAAVRRDPFQSALYPDRRHRIARAGRPGLRAPAGPRRRPRRPGRRDPAHRRRPAAAQARRPSDP